MKVGIAIALVCIAFGVLWRLKPDYMKYGWWGKDLWIENLLLKNRI